MDAEAIQRFCLAGTDAYLEFLIENDKGVEEIGVSRVERVDAGAKPWWKLVLETRLYDPDATAIRLTPPGLSFGASDFEVVEYDADAKSLLIEPRNPALDLADRRREEVTIVCDLRFLVRNVRFWFEANGLELGLPHAAHQAASPQAPPEAQPLDCAQRRAVEASLANPLAYVWGPPGTGKTGYVLAAAVVNLAAAGRKVGVYAPTNNALEQALSAVICRAESCGLDRRTILRVGRPSASFARAFPEVCEIQGLADQVMQLRSQGQLYKRILEHRRGATVLGSAAVLRHEIAVLAKLLASRRDLCGAMSGGILRRVASVLTGDRVEWERQLRDIEIQVETQLEVIRRTRTASDRLNNIVAQLDLVNVPMTELAVGRLESQTADYLRANEALAREYAGVPTAELERLCDDLACQAEELERLDLDQRIDAASVIGMTLDCHIGRYRDRWIQFEHAFLDEAGYAPVVKALTLFRRGVPLTFIGDHKQLGPVCEMNPDAVTGTESPLVWKRPALVVDDLFDTEDSETLLARWRESSEPSLRGFHRSQLAKIYRFGQNLATILSECVYGGVQLAAADEREHLLITWLDAVPEAPPDLGRQNLAEAERIASFVESDVEFNDGAECAWAILAPYTRQVALLGQLLPRARRAGRIMTIHRAQGREWNVVILSVVDGHYNRPWFTNTTNRTCEALNIMNTAVSRARKQLVLVCDSTYWTNRPDSDRQLVSRLLNVSQPPID